jgi:hypothetical protein
MKELSVSVVSNTQSHTETPRAIDYTAGHLICGETPFLGSEQSPKPPKQRFMRKAVISLAA